MPAVGVTGQGRKVRHDPRTKRIEMEVADQLKEVRLLLNYNRLVPVLEEMAGTVMPAVEGSCIPCKQRSHSAGEWLTLCPDQEVGVVGQQSPGVDPDGLGQGQVRKAADEVVPIAIVPEDGTALDPPHHNMVQDPRRIKARATGHEAPSLTLSDESGNVPFSFFRCRCR